VLCSSQNHLGTGKRDLDHHVLAGAKNTDRHLVARLGFELFFFNFIIFLLVLGLVFLRFGVRTLFGKVATFTAIEALKLFLR
jgi:hypothetical protein